MASKILCKNFHTLLKYKQRLQDATGTFLTHPV